MINRRRFVRQFKKVIGQPKFARIYLSVSIAILFVTTAAWSLIGSIIELGNADQLANTFLTQNLPGALLPDQHTFLLKLPFFWLVNMLSATPFAFCFVTVLVTLLTVGLFALILYKIERRPFYIGTLLLALSLVLIMIPAQSYAGANLPVNMAMLTTRNLEYILYIAILMLVIRSRRWLDGYLLVATLLMTVLVASDKLFLSMGIGAALIVLIVSFLPRQLLLRKMALRWLAISVLGAGAATLLLFVLSSLHIFHSVGQGSVGPYGLVSGVKGLAQAIVYGILSLFTNFGANPGFDGRTPSTVISLALGRLAGPLLPVYVLTLGIFAGAIIAIVRLARFELTKLRPKKQEIPSSLGLTVALVASTLSALILFIVSNHYYPVDARYVSIVTFAGFVGLATYATTRRRHYRERFTVTGIFLLIGLGLSVFFVTSTLHQQTTTTSDLARRNSLVAQALKLNPVDTLLGDYWRVLPIKLASPDSQQVVDPLASCTVSRPALSNTAWTKDDTSHSFAYLLTLDHPSTDFPACTLQNVTDAYGRPDSSVVISGTQTNPQELLLFYDKGIHKTAPGPSPTSLTDTVIPAPLASLAHTTCDKDTIMNIVAHEDDDILFMNPDLLHEIQAGDCIRSIYVTAGDAGSDGPYWLGRQTGAEAAYATMLGLKNPAWTERQIILSPTEVVTVANPRGVSTVSLIFMHLPDGSPNGDGYGHSGDQSLAKLRDGSITAIKTVDNASTYTNDSLLAALLALLDTYQPAKIQSQSIQAGGRYTDHSDHTTVGHYVQQAVELYQNDPTNPALSATYYLGYPSHSQPANVTGDDFTAKFNIFMAFSQYDSASCHSLQQCDNSSVYGIYLRRQYTTTY